MKKQTLKSLLISELLINNIFHNDEYQLFIKDNLVQFFDIERLSLIKEIEQTLKNVLKFKIVKFINENKLVNTYAIKLQKVLRGPITEWAEEIFSK